MTENPLRQYFRRPAVYIKLPSNGEGYPEGSIDMPENREIPIYPMTAIDEITTRTPDALFNGTAVVELIKSCVPNIKDPWKVTNVDLDPLLIAIRAATYGTKMEIDTKCEKCETEAKYDVDLTNLMSQFKSGSYEKPLILNEVQIKFVPMAFTEINKAGLIQFELQKTLQILLAIEDDEERNLKTGEALKKINDTYLDLLTEMIQYIRVPDAIVLEKEYIKDFLKNCDKQTYDRIREYSLELREASDLKPLKMKCMNCSHEYDQTFTVNVTDFFG